MITKKTTKGTVLAYMLVMLGVVSILLTSILGYVSSQLRFSIAKTEREKAFQVAEAGIYFYKWYLAHQTDGKTTQQINAFWAGSPLGVDTPYQATYQGMGDYEITVTRPVNGSTAVNVTSTGWTDKAENLKRSIKVRFRRPSWSEYLFLSNSFMNFGAQAEVYGKVFSNVGIRFDGLAHNTVGALPASFDDPSHGGGSLEFGVHTHDSPTDPDAPAYPWLAGTVPTRSDVFEGGRIFPAPEVSFNGVTTDLSSMKSEAQGGNGRYFNNDGEGRKILFKSDGTYDICTVNTQNTNTHAIGSYLGVVWGATGSYSGDNGDACTVTACCSGTACPLRQSSRPARGRCVSKSNYPVVDDGVIFVEDNAWVDGEINNDDVTVVAANLSGGNQADIYIGTENMDLKYASYNCDNKLGLVAQRDVRVLGSCPVDYTVDAALLAQTGTVGINDNGFSGKNSLTFNGAIASYLQPYFQHGVSGFAVRLYNFDNDLLYCPPPYFPTGTQYAMDLWEEE